MAGVPVAANVQLDNANEAAHENEPRLAALVVW